MITSSRISRTESRRIGGAIVVAVVIVMAVVTVVKEARNQPVLPNTSYTLPRHFLGARIGSICPTLLDTP